MKKSAKSVSQSVIETAPITLEAVAAMTQAERIKAFASNSKAANKIYLILGIYRHVIESELKAGQKINTILTAAGADRANISNAGYAAKAFRVLCTGETPSMGIDEFFSVMTFAKCKAVSCHATGKDAPETLPAFPLTAQNLVTVIRHNPKTAVDEIASLGSYGMMIADKAKADKDAETATAKATADKVKADKDAALAAKDALLKEAVEKLEAVKSQLGKPKGETTEETTEEQPAVTIHRPETTETTETTETETETETTEEPETVETTEETTVETVKEIAPFIPNPAPPVPPTTEAEIVEQIKADLDGIAEMMESLKSKDALKEVMLHVQCIHCELDAKLSAFVSKMPKGKAA